MVQVVKRIIARPKSLQCWKNFEARGYHTVILMERKSGEKYYVIQNWNISKIVGTLIFLGDNQHRIEKHTIFFMHKMNMFPICNINKSLRVRLHTSCFTSNSFSFTSIALNPPVGVRLCRLGHLPGRRLHRPGEPQDLRGGEWRQLLQEDEAILKGIYDGEASMVPPSLLPFSIVPPSLRSPFSTSP